MPTMIGTLRVNKKIKCPDMRNLIAETCDCLECSKETYLERSIRYPQHMFWLKNNKMIFNYAPLSEGIQKDKRLSPDFLSLVRPTVGFLLLQ